MTGPPLFVVDAFAEGPFTGNPAGVCLLSEPAPDPWMRALAREVNHSETAFLLPQSDGWRLRWFTPKAEVDLCGHATLASAHVLWEEGLLPPGQEARFHTLSGLVSARREGAWVELDFPAEVGEEVEAPPELTQALGATLLYTGRNRLDYLVEVESEDVLRALVPDLGLLTRVEARGVIATSRPRAEGYDYVCRVFAPQLGIDEDPVTGSAQCYLGPYWSDRLGKEKLLAYQASPRGGTLRVRPEGNRVRIGGKAVTVLKGRLLHGPGQVGGPATGKAG